MKKIMVFFCAITSALYAMETEIELPILNNKAKHAYQTFLTEYGHHMRFFHLAIAPTLQKTFPENTVQAMLGSFDKIMAAYAQTTIANIIAAETGQEIALKKDSDQQNDGCAIS